MPAFYGAIDLVKNELRNAVIQNLGSAPSSPVKGLVYFNSTDNTFYWYDGTTWKSAAGATPATTVTASAVLDTSVVGVATTYAREDHKHAREGFGAVANHLTFGMGTNNGGQVTVARSDHVHGTPNHDNAAHSAINLSALGLPTASVSMGNFGITNLSAPGSPNDAANKAYVDNLSAGLSWKDSVRVATTANLASLNGAQSVDGITPIAGERVLVKNQTTASANGIYVVAAGAWTRATDADSAGELEGCAVFVQEGTTQSDQGFVCTTNAPITVGTTNLSFVQFTGTGGPPTGPAGGDLTGSYPNPTLIADAVETAAIQNNAVTDQKLATMTGNSVKGKLGAGLGAVTDLSTTQVTTLIDVFTSGLKGVAPPSGGGTTNFLRADGTWAPSGVAAGTVLKYSAALTGTTSPETVTHNLNTRDIHLSVYNGSTPYTAVEVDWDATTANTAVIRFNPALGAGYRVVVMG